MAKQASILVLVVKMLCAGIITCSIMYCFFVFGPAIETRYFPAFGKFTVVSMEAAGPNATTIVVEFTKLRGCAPGTPEYYKGKRSGPFEPITIHVVKTTAGEDPGRPIGTQRSAPGVVDADQSTIMNNMFVDITSRCWPLWMTRSEVLP